jgi:hypothetical protein
VEDPAFKTDRKLQKKPFLVFTTPQELSTGSLKWLILGYEPQQLSASFHFI